MRQGSYQNHYFRSIFLPSNPFLIQRGVPRAPLASSSIGRNPHKVFLLPAEIARQRYMAPARLQLDAATSRIVRITQQTCKKGFIRRYLGRICGWLNIKKHLRAKHLPPEGFISKTTTIINVWQYG
jgi:hypothetical protein